MATERSGPESASTLGPRRCATATLTGLDEGLVTSTSCGGDRADVNDQLWPATLYGSLEALTDEGLIHELTGEEHPEGRSNRRRYYRITPRGHAVLLREAKRLSLLAHIALERLEA